MSERELEYIGTQPVARFAFSKAPCHFWWRYRIVIIAALLFHVVAVLMGDVLDQLQVNRLGIVAVSEYFFSCIFHGADANHDAQL